MSSSGTGSSGSSSSGSSGSSSGSSGSSGSSSGSSSGGGTRFIASESTNGISTWELSPWSD